MNMTLTNIKEHAEVFDLIYIKGRKNKSLNIFCANETLIEDYIVLKTVLTEDLRSVIIMSPLQKILCRDLINEKLQLSGLDSQCARYHKKDTIVFHNRGKIDFIDHDNFANKLSGTKFDLIYIGNSALEKVFHDDNAFIYTLLEDNGRIIYNFDAR